MHLHLDTGAVIYPQNPHMIGTREQSFIESLLYIQENMISPKNNNHTNKHTISQNIQSLA